MRFLPIYLVLCWLMFVATLSAQTTISGTVTDAETGSALVGATVQVTGSDKGDITDATGKYRLEITGNSAIVRVQYLGYKPMVERVFPSRQVVYDFALTPQEVTLETTIISDQKVQRVYPDKQTMVIDYAFLKDDVLVIIYDPKRKRNVLQLLSADFVILSEYDNPAEPPRALFRDCLGASHCISEHFAGQVDLGPADHLILRSDSLHLFQRYVEPCQASIDSVYYYAAMSGDYVKQFTFTHSRDKRMHTLYTCVDKKAITSVEEENKMIIRDAGSATNAQRASFQANLNKAYLKAVAFPPIYVPIHVISGMICIFDHPHQRILRFDKQGNLYDYTPLDYTKLRDWKREVFTNVEGTKAYTLTEKDGYFTVHQIDLATGQLAQGWELPFPFVQKIGIRGKYIYFTYRDKLDDQVKRLYRLEQ